MTISHAAIVGAGISGLTAALALARHGISSEIFEQADALAEVGAGLQISPNASRCLAKIGVLGRLEGQWREPKKVALASGLTLKELAHVPVGEARKRWGAPYGTLHRATLQSALKHAVADEPLATLRLGARIDKANRATLSGRTEKPADVIICADGVWSHSRRQIKGAPEARFSGNIAWRFVLSSEDAPGFLERDSVTAFMGPMAHLVAYPLRDVGGFNLVAIAAGASAGEAWHTEVDSSWKMALERHFKGWNPELTRLFSADKPTFWPLYEAGEGNWHNGSDTIVIGDAAHALMPFSAQGAAMAIEDGFELAAFLAGMEAPQAFEAFVAHRKPRLAALRKRTSFNKFAYHASGPIRIGRDIVLKLRSPETLAGELDWLYGYHAYGLDRI
ncbi:FAD-dependent monooxygenase [Martelella lutilitoris]|uniref:FAD-dependent monooxygenase n=1 Tax=Martelella lutilitoris TaxID=2583532 RepID=A0A7T7KK02_9HYPH|nr:FAD-dependent monooxygenase [Martelella lutilitoris]QQM29177.1 FAD-dependent monooxygenase [Martelella lutilitoris]